MRQRIKPMLYFNILELYNLSPDFKKAVDEDKISSTFENYLDDYSDKPDIVGRVLSDTLDTLHYDFKVGRQRHWKLQTVTIIEKPLPTASDLLKEEEEWVSLQSNSKFKIPPKYRESAIGLLKRFAEMHANEVLISVEKKILDNLELGDNQQTEEKLRAIILDAYPSEKIK